MSQHESSASAQAKNQAFVTKEVFNSEMGKIQTALQTLLAKHEGLASRSKDGTEMTSPPVTMVGGHSQSTLSVVETLRLTRGCS